MNDAKSDSEPPSPGKILAPSKPTFFGWLRARFFTGVVVAAPIGLTAALVYWFVTFVDNTIKPLIPREWNPDTYLPFAVPGLGLLISVLALTLLGALTANFFGRTIISLGERIVRRVPLVSSIYALFKQVFETFASSSSQNFQEVVLIEYPRKGTWAVGFVSSQTTGEMAKRIGPDHYAVFVPTTPNPTSGFLIFVPTSDVIHTSMTVEEGAKLIVSAGLVSPELGSKDQSAAPTGLGSPTDDQPVKVDGGEKV